MGLVELRAPGGGTVWAREDGVRALLDSGFSRPGPETAATQGETAAPRADPEAMTRAELVAMAEGLGLPVPPKANKAAIAALINRTGG